MSVPAEPAAPPRGVIIWTSELPEPPTPDLIERFGVFPLEFHHGALMAGFDVVRGDTLPRLRGALAAARAAGQKAMIFVYSLRAYDVLALSLYAHRVPVAVYYQNIAPERMPWLKRLFVRHTLGRARLILVQDTLRLASFAATHGASRTRFFPWIVDDVFFRPAVPAPTRTATLFVPGDRGRLDDVVLEIARRTGRRIIRVSRYYPEPVLAAYRACPNIELHYYARWELLLRFYQETALVLNVTDDTETSAGMTSFLEGLAMNALVVTPAGHSSAGYQFPDGFKPYLTIAQPRSVDAWIEAIAAADRHPRIWPDGRTPRDLFLSLSGMAAATQRWRELFAELTR
ncbi:hypothetical protein Verru16b_02829 [Lacunisphaera limnophila]|uniref:Glycosyl transferases group 1 n=1 Tax=Lacunisphaera limnophila TaxID=1838286 RepID=A0A1D8AXX9_9BACT|nr:hypothetical protein [Lacunisphaera limnophila]AOS45742.1 hypothetical protein Verru16b_02829 [Lacunisphaera limnophila]